MGDIWLIVRETKIKAGVLTSQCKENVQSKELPCQQQFRLPTNPFAMALTVPTRLCILECYIVFSRLATTLTGAGDEVEQKIKE
ncbi:unnamed protein product [Allacma fusca]|uniref:Uncharacterized protein n=1 Tax=Allacma fusca TaxID=39272 RepID=A0A8J2P1R7_9HEXA|nr:unnamed protein product [Allacma fusca]